MSTITTRPASPPGTAPPPARPSTRGYWLGGGLLAAVTAGAVVWVVLAFVGWAHHLDGFQRVTVPGSATVHLDRPTTRVLYYERQGDASATDPTGIQVTGPGGAVVLVERYGADLRYDVPGGSGRVGRAVASFRADRPGDYRVAVDVTAGTPPGSTLAMGDDVMWEVAPHLVGAAALFLVGAAAGVGLLVLTRTRRAPARGWLAPQ